MIKIQKKYELPILVAFILITVSGSFLLFAGAWNVGISTDENYHIEATENFLSENLYLSDNYLNDSNYIGLDHPHNYVYAPLWDIFSHQINILVGLENYGELSNEYQAFQVRHTLVASLFFSLLIITFYIIFILTNSLKYSLLQIVILLSLPELIGHAMFNAKDAVPMVGVTFFSFSLIFLLYQKKFLFALAGLLGVVLSLGTRPGLWILLLLILLAYLLALFMIKFETYEILRQLLKILLVSVLGYVILILTHPKLYLDVPNFLIRSLLNSSNYWAVHPTLTNGRIEIFPISQRYTLDWIITEIPFGLLLILISGGTLIILAFLGRGFTRQKISKRHVLLLVMFVQAFALPIYSFFTDSNFYSGLRQILFIFPALGVLIMYSCKILLNYIKSNRVKLLFLYSLIAYLGLISFEQWKISPFSYAYVSEIRTFDQVLDQWPSDYWRLSYRELAPKVGGDGLAVCNPYFQNRGSDQEFLSMEWPFTNSNNCENDPRFEPFLSSRGIENEFKIQNDLQFWLIRSNDFGYNLPSNCVLFDEVVRDFRNQKVMMSYVALCEHPTNSIEYLENVTISSNSASPFLLNGWSPAEKNWVWSEGEQAIIAFKLPDDFKDEKLIIELEGDIFEEKSLNRDLSIYVNNEMVHYRKTLKDKNFLYTFVVEKYESLVSKNIVVIRLATPNGASPSALGLGDDERILGFRLDEITIKVQAGS